jgi:hypothetical protein
MQLLTRPTRISFLAIIFAGAASAQFRGAIQGSVLDPAQAVVPGVDITLRNDATSQERRSASSAEGFYRFSELPPGTYSLVAKKSGFADLNINNIHVAAEAVAGIDLHLQTAQVSSSITVNGDTTGALETEQANIQRSISSTEILRLPEVGRDPYELLRLTPGVFGNGSRNGSGQSIALPNTTGPRGSNLSIFQSENQVPIVSDGQRLSANNYLLDGVSVNSLTWGGAAVVTPNQESINEITVSSNACSADLGRNSGAQVQVVSKRVSSGKSASAGFAALERTRCSIFAPISSTRSTNWIWPPSALAIRTPTWKTPTSGAPLPGWPAAWSSFKAGFRSDSLSSRRVSLRGGSLLHHFAGAVVTDAVSELSL